MYMNPPDQAIVLSVDEKSQIQALDRTRPMFSLRPGLPAPQTHDYQSHGTTTLFAALNALEGTVIGKCQPRHRHQEFLRCLDRIDQSVDATLDIHLVLDNYGTHKHPDVNKCLAARPRYQVHFTPTSSSWLNQIERWFAEITRKRARRGTFRSVPELIKTIRDYIRLYNQNSRPFLLVASGSRIIRKVHKYRRTSETGD
jgi:transposase